MATPPLTRAEINLQRFNDSAQRGLITGSSAATASLILIRTAQFGLNGRPVSFMTSSHLQGTDGLRVALLVGAGSMLFFPTCQLSMNIAEKSQMVRTWKKEQGLPYEVVKWFAHAAGASVSLAVPAALASLPSTTQFELMAVLAIGSLVVWGCTKPGKKKSPAPGSSVHSGEASPPSTVAAE